MKKTNCIISGEQTGCDRAVMNFALQYGLNYEGYIPKGRRAEDGALPFHYDKLKEGDSNHYSERT